MWQKFGFLNHRSLLSNPNALTDPSIWYQAVLEPIPPLLRYPQNQGLLMSDIQGFGVFPRCACPSHTYPPGKTLSAESWTWAGNRKKKHDIDARAGRDLRRERPTTLRGRVASQYVKDQTGGTHAADPGAAQLPPSLRGIRGQSGVRPCQGRCVPPSSYRWRVRRGVKLPNPPFLLS